MWKLQDSKKQFIVRVVHERGNTKRDDEQVEVGELMSYSFSKSVKSFQAQQLMYHIKIKQLSINQENLKM